MLNKSTVDYNGMYKGIYIDFVVKETNKDSIFIGILRERRIDRLSLLSDLEGIASLIIGLINGEDHFFELNYKDIIKLSDKKIKKNKYRLLL